MSLMWRTVFLPLKRKIRKKINLNLNQTNYLKVISKGFNSYGCLDNYNEPKIGHQKKFKDQFFHLIIYSLEEIGRF